MGNIIEECHAPCKLNSYIDFEIRVGASLPLQKTSFSYLSNVVGPVCPSNPYFYILIVFIYCIELGPVRKIAEMLLTGQ